MRRLKSVAAAAFVLAFAGQAEARPLRVMSLDQCADQYVLALAPDADLALSPRADDADSWMKDAAEGRRRIRPTLEAAVGFQPDVVVRYWGGEPRLLAALERRGTRVVTIRDAADLNAVRDVVRTVSEGLGQPSRGRAMVARFDQQLSRIPRRSRGSALYLTAGGFTAGPGTLIGAILAAAGYANLAASPGFAAVSVERIALQPPSLFVLGFFDQIRSDWRGPGRHPVVRRAAEGRTAARLPAAALSCPAWFAADAAAILADAR